MKQSGLSPRVRLAEWQALAPTRKAWLSSGYERTALPLPRRHPLTFIDIFNTRASLAARGKSREGRSQLRILGLALRVTGDCPVDPERFPDEVCAYRTTTEVFGRSFTVLVTDNENLFRTQTQTIECEVAKRQAKLRNCPSDLSRWQRARGRGCRPSLASATKAFEKILCGRHMRELFDIEITSDSQQRPGLCYRFDRTAYPRLHPRQDDPVHRPELRFAVSSRTKRRIQDIDRKLKPAA